MKAIESLEGLGADFTLASHDLEIRGAGELLGDEQSGQIQEAGFSRYTKLLERAVKAFKEGKEPNLDQPFEQHSEIDLKIPALLPDDYLPDATKNLVRITELKLKAKPIGIKRIEAGPASGRLIFNEQPNIDPMRIINLIQKQHKIFKLDGQDKLRFFLPMDSSEERIEAVDKVLDESL